MDLIRYRNKGEKLERALWIAKREFAAHGYDGCRISKIATESRCSSETIYSVYGSKDGLWRAALQKALRRGAESFEAAKARDAGCDLSIFDEIIEFTMAWLLPTHCFEYAALYMSAVRNESALDLSKDFFAQKLFVISALSPIFEKAHRSKLLKVAPNNSVIDAYIDLCMFRVAAVWAHNNDSGKEHNLFDYRRVLHASLKAFCADGDSFSFAAKPTYGEEGAPEPTSPQGDDVPVSNADWLFGEVAAGAWEWHVSEKFLRCSKSWLALNGLPEHDPIVHFSFVESTREKSDLKVAKTALKAHMNGESDYYLAEFRIKTPSGERKWFTDKGKVVSRDEAGNPLRMVGILTDISHMRR